LDTAQVYPRLKADFVIPSGQGTHPGCRLRVPYIKRNGKAEAVTIGFNGHFIVEFLKTIGAEGEVRLALKTQLQPL